MSATWEFILLAALTLGTVVGLAKPLGSYLARVMEGRVRWARIVEDVIYRVIGRQSREEMSWSEYAVALMAFNLAGALALYGLQRLQFVLPLNPEHLAAVSADSSFNTAISFVTNTDWQGYGGESTMGYFVQMAGLAVQNFLSAATGAAVAIALIRAFARSGAKTIGNFWVDVTRIILYVLLPMSAALALALVSQGVIQNFDANREVTLVEKLSYDNPQIDDAGNPQKDKDGTVVTQRAVTGTQTLPMGPVASQEAIKQLGTNGGGFFNANSAHPFENPTPLSNILQMMALLLLPIALTYTFGLMVGDTRQGWVLLAAMLVMFAVLASLAFQQEQSGNPTLAQAGVDAAYSTAQSGGNMEGKETRFGIAASALFAAATTATSCGAVNSMHDSMTPLGGFVPLFLMQLGELVPGGVGTGLYTVLIFALLGVFIAGLMIGRTPEYLGKKIQAREMKFASLFILVTPFVVLTGTALAVSVDAGAAGIANPGAHGFTEILYAYTSAGNNNGSAFAGLSANTSFYNLSLGIVMWIGRFWPIVAALAIAGSLAEKVRVPVTEGSMPTHGALFVCLLIGTVVLIGVLNYVPALALGPVVEHFQLGLH